jgi:magnesium chelatase family protein
MAARIQSIISTGTRGIIVDIECHLSNNLPNIVIVGFANKAVDESRERIRGSFATSHIMLPRKRITINLAPADIPKADSGFDLAIAVAILAASDQVTQSIDVKQAFIGELGLDGSVRAVRGIIGKLLAGRTRGITTFFIPSANLQQAQLIPNIQIMPLDNLGQLYGYLCGGLPIHSVNTGAGLYEISGDHASGSGIQLSEVVGQLQAKRALEIAAAGGHNVFFSGPPGTGKSMLAKALPSILPPLNREETLEVTHLHSLASHDYEKIVSERPFRSPHHSASHVALVGGGSTIRPGEISLAHRGILFLDELPEFQRETVEALRQPLEDRVINVARARDSVEYPANFVLVATANPCPCGLFGSDKACSCSSKEILQYQNRLSGPILDRIDLQCNVSEVDHERLLTQEADPKNDANIRRKIQRARNIQASRFNSSHKLNADMTNEEVKHLLKFDIDTLKILNMAAKQNKMSARSYMRTIKVAQTIADLSNQPTILTDHITEALAYRELPKVSK